MAVIPPSPNSIAHAIYETYTKKQKEKPRRQHLGASEVGKECARQAWYNFRWVEENNFDGRMLRLFETGDLEEIRLVKSLKALGIRVHEVDKDGKQFGFSDLGGHFSGSTDGAALGILAAPKTWHILEFKTHNAKSFAKLLNHGVESAKPEHYIQVQIYMHYSGMTRALYLACNKDTSEIYEERIEYDAGVALKFIARAKEIIFSPVPLVGISESPKAFVCRYCNFRENCFTPKLPQLNCRTCLHSTPKESGGWFCEKHEKPLDFETQKVGCEKHLFIPPLINMVQVDANSVSVEYLDGKGKTWINKEGGKFDAA